MAVHDKLRNLAKRQYGVVSSVQAAALGVSKQALFRLTQLGWRRVHRGVYACGAETPAQRALAAALLHERAVVSHGTAMALWRLEGWKDGPAEITVPYRASCRRGSAVKVHRAYIPEADRFVLRGIPITGLARTLIDLSADLGLVDLAIALEDARRRKDLQLSWIYRRLDVNHSQGRHGAASLRAVMADCLARDCLLESALEVRVWWLIKWSGLPLPEPGWRFDDEEGQPGRLDFAYPGIQLALEVDGFAFHGARDAFERDRKRLSRVAALGWRVIHITYAQLADPQVLLNRIRRALSP